MFPMAYPDYPIHYNPFLSKHMTFEEVAYEPFAQDFLTIQKNATDFGIPLGSSSRSQKDATYLGVSSGSSSSQQNVAVKHVNGDEVLMKVPTYLGVSSGSSSSQQNVAVKHVNGDEVLMKVHQFKKFDIVQDPSDHHYVHTKSSFTQPSKRWVKKIQEEWKILEKELPDTIFIRAYESRMDLLRAVIIGAEGTPYHDAPGVEVIYTRE